MKLASTKTFFRSTVLLSLLIPALAQAVVVNVVPIKDNTIWVNNRSNSTSGGLFAGINGGATLQRALIQFDLSAIPAGATINSASVHLRVTQSPEEQGVQPYDLHRLTQDWGEGITGSGGDTSGGGAGVPDEVGSASWSAPFFGGAAWTTPGGDFVATASASTSVASGLFSFTSTQLATDVQNWIDGSGNFGWILRGDETVFLGSSKRFASRENTSFQVPTLEIDFTPGVSAVPVPAAIWLFGSGLLGLIGVSRARRT